MEHQNINDLAALHAGNAKVVETLKNAEKVDQDKEPGPTPKTSRLALTASIVSAYVSNNHATKEQFLALIEGVDSTLEVLATKGEVQEPETPPEPAVPILESAQPNYIVCLEDGLRFKSMKRHLSARYGLTPDAYRKRWDLPKDYPMVSPEYSERRRALASNR